MTPGAALPTRFLFSEKKMKACRGYNVVVCKVSSPGAPCGSKDERYFLFFGENRRRRTRWTTTTTTTTRGRHPLLIAARETQAFRVVRRCGICSATMKKGECLGDVDVGHVVRDRRGWKEVGQVEGMRRIMLAKNDGDGVGGSRRRWRSWSTYSQRRR